MNTVHQTSFTKIDTLKTKAIAVILLLFHHLFRTNTYIDAYGINIPFFLEETQLTRMGTDARICVWIFAFLSAYGVSIKLMSAKNNESAIKIIYKQWWSMMKPYWFVYAVFFLLFFHSGYAFHERSILRILIDFIGFSEPLGGNLWNAGWWYMCFAQVLLISLPLLILLVDKTGIFSIPISYLVLQFWGAGFESPYGGYYTSYLYAVLLAILCVKYNLFSYPGTKKCKIFSLAEALCLLLAFLACAHWKVTLSQTDFHGIATLFSGLSVVALCRFVQKHLTFSWLEKFLVTIGKHSGNIYLTHNIVYSRIPDLVFCTKTVAGSTAILLVISLLISITLEFLKKILHYNQMISTLSDKIYKFAVSRTTNHTAP